MVKEVLKCLEDSVADLPEDKREEVKVVILNNWSNQMFYGKRKDLRLQKQLQF
jgi:hypothetical protein